MILFTGILFFLRLLLPANADEMPVQMEMQYTLLLKILTFDKRYTDRLKDEVRIGVVYQQGYRTSESYKDDLMEISERLKLKVGELGVRCIPINIKSENDIISKIRSGDVNVLFVMPLRGVNIEMITGVSRKHDVITYSGVPEYVKEGITIGVDELGGKPKIMINLRGAKDEGVEFSPQLLGLAEIWGEE